MGGTNFLDNLVSTTASVVTGAGVPLLIYGLAFVITVWAFSLVWQGFRKGVKGALRR